MPLINCKVKLKRKWEKYCVLASNGTRNFDAYPNNIIFTIKGTTLYVSVVTLSTKDNQALSEILSKELKQK